MPPAVRLDLIAAPAPILVEPPRIEWPNLEEPQVFFELQEPKIDMPEIELSLIPAPAPVTVAELEIELPNLEEPRTPIWRIRHQR